MRLRNGLVRLLTGGGLLVLAALLLLAPIPALAHIGHAHTGADGHLRVQDHHLHGATASMSAMDAGTVAGPAGHDQPAATAAVPCGEGADHAAGTEPAPAPSCPDGHDPSAPCCLAHCIASHMTGMPVLAVLAGPSVRATPLRPAADLGRDGIGHTPPCPPPLRTA
ncbi:hypothetical protein [Rhodospirillum centenum]|uniref:Uncharacterized protein n=1 Tax=Rhodospirillum centenum (strain ATCC 51521 / SW) TaxID=414684 RepID=B6IS07_RHOCS|nr:hypothetical protein [Rhodospirillum centenum]ACI98243.1 hypothetical protein RC1_0812 [Rhodospirillum centenum SW]